MTALDVTNLSVSRDGAAILREVSFSAAAGAFVGVVGPNGAGKSTLLRALVGLERTPPGAIAINGADLGRLSPRQRARTLAFLPQARDTHWAMTAEAVVSLGRFAYGAPHRLGAPDRAAVDRAIDAADARGFRSRIMPTLSGGEQARVHLARTLAAQTPIIVADEPTAALDLRHAIAILATLGAKASAGGLVVAALHDLALAQRFCTRIIVLERGRLIADGAPGAIFTASLLSATFGLCPDDLAGLATTPAK